MGITFFWILFYRDMNFFDLQILPNLDLINVRHSEIYNFFPKSTNFTKVQKSNV